MTRSRWWAGLLPLAAPLAVAVSATQVTVGLAVSYLF
jgi:hypothetical protein